MYTCLPHNHSPVIPILPTLILVAHLYTSRDLIHASLFDALHAFGEKPVVISRLSLISVLNDISSMYLASLCTVGAFVCVH